MTPERAFTHAELRQLHTREPWQPLLRASVLLGLYAALASVVLVAARSPSSIATPLKLTAWLLMGFTLNGFIQLWHDGWHGTLFRSRAANTVASTVLSLVFFVVNGPARRAHLLHHKHNRTPRDPDAYNVGRKSANLYLQFYGVVFFGLLLSPLHYGVAYPLKHYAARERRRHLFVFTLYLALYGLVFAIVDWSLLSALWLTPLLFASPWMGLKSIADHHANTWRGDALHTATTTRSNAVVTFLWNGLNYHLEHHLFPQVPGYKLPRVHARLAPALRAAGAPVFSRYTQVFSAALLAGPGVIDEDTAFTHPELA